MDDVVAIAARYLALARQSKEANNPLHGRDYPSGKRHPNAASDVMSPLASVRGMVVRRKKIEIYSAGCHPCREVEALVRRVAGADHDVEVCDMFHARVAIEAEDRGIKCVPAVVIDGRFVACGDCIDEAALRSALV